MQSNVRKIKKEKLYILRVSFDILTCTIYDLLITVNLKHMLLYIENTAIQ